MLNGWKLNNFFITYMHVHFINGNKRRDCVNIYKKSLIKFKPTNSFEK